jgi:gag-polypeptide of LTR copia-type
LHLNDNTHTCTIWNMLCARFERTNGVMVLHAHSNLVGCRYKNRQDLREHLDKMSTLWGNANAVGADIRDHKYCHILHRSLPINWGPFVGTLFGHEDPVELEGHLLSYHDWYVAHASTAPVTSAWALLADSSIICNNCWKVSHTRDQCWAPGGGAEGKMPKHGIRKNGKMASQGTSGPVAAHISVMDEVAEPDLPPPSANLIDLLIAITDVESVVTPAWKTYADSGASYHYFSQ